MKEYVGDTLQVRGAERYMLQDGRGNGMQFLWVRNGLGLEAWISLDRCADLARVTFAGDNMGFFAPCGYVAPAYYDDVGTGFLKSFTAGFMTTCGLAAAGAACVDEGEPVPLHGTVSHIPAQLCAVEEDAEGLTVRATVRDGCLFGRKLVMRRTYRFSYTENTIAFTDTVTNEADVETPYMMLYHCNMGYPLLDETSRLCIPHTGITPRNAEAAAYMDTALQVEPPQAKFVERCYYYDVAERDGLAHVGLFNSRIGKGMAMSYDRTTLPCFTEWKMMGKRDYVLGLEPGNCLPDGRDVMRSKGMLQTLAPDESATTGITFRFYTDENAFKEVF